MSNDRAFRNAQAAYDRAEPPHDARLDAQYEIKAHIVEDCRRDEKLRMEVIEEMWHPYSSVARMDAILDRMLTRGEPQEWAVDAIWKMLEDAMERMAAYRVAARDDE